MPLNHFHVEVKAKSLKRTVLEYLILIISSVFVVTLITNIWAKDTGFVHTLVELLCIFIALSTFMIVWHNFEHTNMESRVLGFGFLCVAFFDILHTYNFPQLGFYPKGYYDLSMWYSIYGRISEVVVLLISVKFIPALKLINKWTALIISASTTCGAAFLLFKAQEVLPKLFIHEKGLSPWKVILEYFIILLFIICIYFIKDKVNNKHIIGYNYILFGIFFIIPAQICFTVYKTTDTYIFVLGHLFKLLFYYYLFKGIFISSVKYPYEKLKSAGKYMSDILNALPIGLTTFDANSKLTFMNSRAENLMALSQKMMVGQSFDEIAKQVCSKEDYQVIKGQVSDIAREFKNYIAAIKKGDGECTKLKYDLHKIQNGGYIFLFDEAKKEQELENLQLQTQTIFNSISSTIMMTDKTDNIIMCNRAFEQVFEVDSKDVLGMSKRSFNELLQCNINHISHRGEEGQSNIYEVSIITQKGSRKQLILHTAHIHNVEGEVIGRISVGTDITALKNEQQKVQHQEKLALLGQMGAAIVHETKNYLATIKGCSQLIALKAEDEKMRHYAHKIDSMTNDVNRVICDFLSMSKPHTPVLKEVFLGELIQSMRFMLESSALIKGIEVYIVTSIEERSIMADEGQIKQVVLNICKNAIDAMYGTKSPRLIIGTELSEAEDEMYILISDNGKGITEEEKSRIGQPFFTTKETGTGLGLNVCYQIIREHRGKIWFESEVGRGTNFFIAIPSKENMDISEKRDKNRLLD
ncbi:MAG: ATP-binding protein [Clostridia bacterium]|nr:ATP-binding protein [Clostridia bacterium]